jgi:hypothetical protein
MGRWDILRWRGCCRCVRRGHRRIAGLGTPSGGVDDESSCSCGWGGHWNSFKPPLQVVAMNACLRYPQAALPPITYAQPCLSARRDYARKGCQGRGAGEAFPTNSSGTGLASANTHGDQSPNLPPTVLLAGRCTAAIPRRPPPQAGCKLSCVSAARPTDSESNRPSSGCCAAGWAVLDNVEHGDEASEAIPELSHGTYHHIPDAWVGRVVRVACGAICCGGCCVVFQRPS